MDKSLNSDDLVDIGEAHHTVGELQQAEIHYRKALEIDPGHPGALYYLANIAHDDGRFPLARELIEQLLREESADAEAWHLLGAIALREEKFADAIDSLDKALALQPGYWIAHLRKGQVLAKQGELHAAIACFNQTLALNPDSGEAYYGLASAQQNLNQLEAAIASYRKAIALNYQPALMYINLANALRFSQRSDEAIAALERAIAIDPNCADAYHGLGNLLVSAKRIIQGIDMLNKSINLNPNSAALRSNLALTLFGIGRLEEAITCLNEAVAIDPLSAETHSILLGLKQYRPHYSRETLYLDHVAFADRFEKPLQAAQPSLTSTDPYKRLRVGFLSADFYRHPVGFFLESILRELHRNNHIEIIIYANNRVVDTLTERLRASAHTWLSVATLSDEALSQRIRADKIDILVDLSGHTVPNRLLVFARKPAPIQITWLGYWATTGLRAMDYIVCDPYCVRADEDKFFVEKLWSLPHTRLCFTSPDQEVAVAALPALQNNYLTFGCFNNLSKMTDQAVAVWAQILKRVSSSRLFLKSRSFADAAISEKTIARFAAHGIAANQLLLEIDSPSKEYLAAYNRVDIALDPYPFPGGTTSVEGLWMGVPMITLQGDRIISRQGESILHNLGLQDWIAQNEDDYVDLAVKKAADLSGLARLRGELRTRLEASPLCDAKLFAQHLEQAFQQMWKNYTA